MANPILISLLLSSHSRLGAVQAHRGLFLISPQKLLACLTFKGEPNRVSSGRAQIEKTGIGMKMSFDTA